MQVEPATPGAPADDAGGNARAMQEQRARMQRTGQSAATGVIQPGMVPRALPTAPTEPAQPGTPGMPEMPQPPTAGEAAAPGRPAGRDGSGCRLAVSHAPTYRRSTGPQPRQASYSSYAALEQQRQLAGMAAYRSFAPPPPPEKVYAGTQVASSGVSPYMQLFRNDTAGGTIDNYTTLVRPQLQQQRMNQQFGTDLWGLQRDARIQQSSLQRMQNNARTLAGRGHAAVLHERRQLLSGLRQSGYGNPGYGNRATAIRLRQGYGRSGALMPEGWALVPSAYSPAVLLLDAASAHCGRITSESMYFRSDFTTPLN